MGKSMVGEQHRISFAAPSSIAIVSRSFPLSLRVDVPTRAIFKHEIKSHEIRFIRLQTQDSHLVG